MCVQYQENLHQRRKDATDRREGSKTECCDEQDYSRDLPSGNRNHIDDAVAKEHSRRTHTQEQQSAASRTTRKHRKQSLHESRVKARRVPGESQKEAGANSSFEGD